MRFGARLRELRDGAEMSQSQLDAPYFTRAHISEIELDKVTPTLKIPVFLAHRLERRAVLPEDL